MNITLQSANHIPTSIDNTDDIIDSRDVIERLNYLMSGFELITGKDVGDISSLDAFLDHALACDCDSAEVEEYKALQTLADGAEGYAAELLKDWQYGGALIRESYFTEYAIELLKDCGDLPSEIPWYIEIDEEATARNLLMDYTAVDFDGVTYYIR